MRIGNSKVQEIKVYDWQKPGFTNYRNDPKLVENTLFLDTDRVGSGTPGLIGSRILNRFFPVLGAFRIRIRYNLYESVSFLMNFDLCRLM